MTVEAIKGYFNDDGSMKNLDGLKDYIRLNLKGLHDSQKVLIDASLANALALATLQHSQADKQREAEAQERFSLAIAASQSSFQITSFLLDRGGDHDTARLVQSIGDTSARASAVIDQFQRNLRLSTSLASVVAAGNLVGVYNQASTLFSNQPTAEQTIISDLALLRQEQQQTRKEMHQRFDEVDRALQAIVESLNANFSVITTELAEANNGTTNLQIRLNDLSVHLDQLETKLQGLFATAAQREFANVLADCFPNDMFLAHTEQVSIEPSSYASCLKKFFSYATSSARDAISLNMQPLDINAPELGEVLLDYPLSYNIKLLMSLASNPVPTGLGNTGANVAFRENGGPVNPSEWSRGAEAFLRMMFLRPDLVNTLDPKYLNAIEADGESLNKSILALSHINGDPKAKANRLFAQHLIDNYNARAKDLAATIPALVNSYERLNLPSSFSLWKVYSTDYSIDVALPNMDKCSWNDLPPYMNTPIPPPKGFSGSWIKPFFEAKALKLTNVGLCYEITGQPFQNDTMLGFRICTFSVHVTVDGKSAFVQPYTVSCGNDGMPVNVINILHDVGSDGTLASEWSTVTGYNRGSTLDDLIGQHPDSVRIMDCGETDTDIVQTTSRGSQAIPGLPGITYAGVTSYPTFNFFDQDGGEVCKQLRKQYQALRKEFRNEIVNTITGRRTTLDGELSDKARKQFKLLTSAKALLVSFVLLATPHDSSSLKMVSKLFDGSDLVKTTDEYYLRDFESHILNSNKGCLTSIVQGMSRETEPSPLVAATLEMVTNIRSTLEAAQKAGSSNQQSESNAK